jgi:hypothetical protein
MQRIGDFPCSLVIANIPSVFGATGFPVHSRFIHGNRHRLLVGFLLAKLVHGVSVGLASVQFAYVATDVLLTFEQWHKSLWITGLVFIPYLDGFTEEIEQRKSYVGGYLLVAGHDLVNVTVGDGH